jgi:selenide,water dikinase
VIVLVGAGHANLQVLERAWRDKWPEGALTLITPYPEAQYSAMLPSVIAGFVPAEESRIPLARLCWRAGATLLLDRVASIDTRQQQVRLASGKSVGYEWCSLNVGSTPAGLDVPGALAHSIAARPLDTLARRVGSAWLGESSTIAVVGGGPAAVELALALKRRYGNNTLLYESNDRLLPTLPPRAGRLAEAVLQASGVEVCVGFRVEQVQPGGLHAGKKFQAADLVLWSTGPAAPQWLLRSDLDCDDKGYVLVKPTLQTVTSERVFAVGDCASLLGRTLPKSGVYSVRMGEVLAENLRAALYKKTYKKAFKTYSPQRRSLTLISLANGSAIGAYGRLAWSGGWSFRWKMRLDRAWMRRFTEGV